MSTNKRLTLVLGIHNHQPIGNFDSVFEHAVEKSYEPFLAMLERHPHIKLAQHYSGILLDWIVERRPDLIKRLKALVGRNQVEMMGGAYYEAILSVIPDGDKMRQLTKLSGSLKKLFGKAPRGMWLAERVWEQHLAKQVPATYLLLASAMLLEFAVFCVGRLSRLSSSLSARPAGQPEASPIGGSILSGLSHALKSPYLVNVSLFLLLFAITSTFLYFQQAEIDRKYFADRGARTAFICQSRSFGEHADTRRPVVRDREND